MPSRRRALLILAGLCGLALFSIALALMVGSIQAEPSDVFSALFGESVGENIGAAGDSTMAREIVRSLRLPRALGGFACGGLLALAGALLQVLLRNPLADPYVLGISGGAGLGALAAIFLGFSVTGINSFAFVGALGAMSAVFGLARGEGSWTQTRLLLTGVIVAAGCGAATALLLSVAPEHKLHGMLFWLMGDLAQTNDPMPVLVVLGAILLLCLPYARELNLLAIGSNTAQVLGVAVKRLRLGIFFVASIATAAAVTHAGSIGFIGLIVPHLVRLATGNDQRLLLPASVLAGGSLLVIADTLARSLVAPQQLPVGVLTALIGVPVFLFLLSRESRTGR